MSLPDWEGDDALKNAVKKIGELAENMAKYAIESYNDTADEDEAAPQPGGEATHGSGRDGADGGDVNTPEAGVKQVDDVLQEPSSGEVEEALEVMERNTESVRARNAAHCTNEMNAGEIGPQTEGEQGPSPTEQATPEPKSPMPLGLGGDDAQNQLVSPRAGTKRLPPNDNDDAPHFETSMPHVTDGLMASHRPPRPCPPPTFFPALGNIDQAPARHPHR
ncbi:hypothetical protein FOMPIDRAFT_1056810 [Fomitopsis schrenkii]|uniref:Uncharacterized protein n=1 Tax=Fomitopsis schrenkii TaxID=2126942 RepID=S8ERS9_FOMSC|nr:hypothetical protein FOMPIDRAFT_1056810 [Fomitopsis schrenkii]